MFTALSEHTVEGVRDILVLFLPKLRVWALNILCKSFKPSVAIADIQERMLFDGVEECAEWVKSIGCVLDAEGRQLMLKESKQAVSESKLLQGGFD